MTISRCRLCGGPAGQPGPGRPAGVCAGCRGDRPFYGGDHKNLRAKWAETVDAGEALCLATVCLFGDRRILPGQGWDLGHDDNGGWRGTEHSRCNRSAGGVKGNPRPERQPTWRTTVDW
jgi:hypothetical protein